MYEYGSKVQINDKQHPQHLHVGTICGFVDVVGEPTAYYIDIGIASVHAYWYQLDALGSEPPLDGDKPVDYYLDSMGTIGTDDMGGCIHVDEYGMFDDVVPYIPSDLAHSEYREMLDGRYADVLGLGYDYEPLGLPPLANDRDGGE